MDVASRGLVGQEGLGEDLVGIKAVMVKME